ncbi:MAG: U32 family peptidase [Clostridia bacterium]|nr:U32 family peptidase [Clostridia bacterium]
MIDLLSPVGNFECLKAAVQNGANSVYFGADLFSARAYASNFSLDELEKAIIYAKTRGVKTNLTLNTLIKDEEFNDAFELAKKAYEFGIDAIIVQDLGLAKQLIKHFPDLDIHASTQMSIHNLQGVLKLQELGFKRVVLSRELSINEIEYICNNSNIEIECFIHGALCISYSGQCLFSSMIGGRSGNRGKCAQPCRLPYELLENNKKIDQGHLLSTRDLFGLDFIPDLINSGVTCLKIEGRMKNPEYVATVTRIYRKYIDLAESSKKYIIDENDRKILLQAFNRGMSSTGHFLNDPNRNLIFKDKPNNMGLFLGKVEKYNKTKGYITVKINEPIEIGDTISLEKETGTYTISELMLKDKNIKETSVGQTITIGRMKGNINLGDKIFKISSKKQNLLASESIKSENRKISLNCKVIIKNDTPVQLQVTSANNLDIYLGLNINCVSDIIPENAKSKPLEKERVLSQINKTKNSLYEFKNIDIELDDNLFLPKISTLNELRRNALELAYNFAVNNIRRTCSKSDINLLEKSFNTQTIESKNKEITVLLNILDMNLDYTKLNGINNIYIPLKYFLNSKYENILYDLQDKFTLYIYMPTIIKANYSNLFYNNIENSIKKYKIKGFIISNISNLELLNDILNDKQYNFELIANYTFNIFNTYSINELKNLNIDRFTISPESNKETITNLCTNSSIKTELIVYGNTPLMNMSYCLLGQSNKCYPTCTSKCHSDNSYYLKDRLNMNFRILFDNIQTVSTIYNSKITSISSEDFNINCARIDILDETIDEINYIVSQVLDGKRLEGKIYTNGNLNR